MLASDSGATQLDVSVSVTFGISGKAGKYSRKICNDPLSIHSSLSFIHTHTHTHTHTHNTDQNDFFGGLELSLPSPAILGTAYCHTVMTVDDELLEDDENITFVIMGTFPSSIIIAPPTSHELTIFDNDGEIREVITDTVLTHNFHQSLLFNE